MWKQSLSSLVMALTLAATAQAVDLSQIDRTIGREPEYQNQARYCLLVFGPEAASRVWLALDGDVMYVDRNADGDLTDEGERFPTMATPCVRRVTVPSVTLNDGSEHTNLRFQILKNDRFWLNITSGDKLLQHVGLGLTAKPTFAADRNLAPVIHFGGPLTTLPILAK